jgi:NADP-dependent 3-hydroxy acid dehydrogenase YdfG
VKVALVTGANTGIGLAIAERLLADGFGLGYATADDDEKHALPFRELSERYGERVHWVWGDLTDPAVPERLVASTVDAADRIDVLVNNAGLMALAPVAKTLVDEWDRMVDINIKGVLYGIAAALPLFRAQGSGHFVNISSVAGHRVGPTMAVYSGTKFAVRAISEGLRQEAGDKLRVTIISPGAVESELAETISDPDLKTRMDDYRTIAIPASAIARAIAFAVEQPSDVDVNEIVVRPTAQPL